MCRAYAARTFCAPSKGALFSDGLLMGPKAVCCFSVSASAAPERNVAANSFISAMSSDLMTRPRRPALPPVAPRPPRAPVRAPPPLLGAGKLAVEHDSPQMEFFARLPHQRPVVAAGDSLAMPVGRGGAMNLRAGRDHQLARVIDILGDKPNDGGLHRGRIHGDDGFTRNQPSERRI